MIRCEFKILIYYNYYIIFNYNMSKPEYKTVTSLFEAGKLIYEDGTCKGKKAYTYILDCQADNKRKTPVQVILKEENIKWRYFKNAEDEDPIFNAEGQGKVKFYDNDLQKSKMYIVIF